MSAAPEPGPQAQSRRALGELGALMLDAGYAVTDVAHTLETAMEARGLQRTRAGVFPQAVLLDDGTGTRMTSTTGQTLTFDQVGRTGRIVAAAYRGQGDWAALRDGVAAVRANPRQRPAWVAIVGNGCMTTGIAVVFGAYWWSLLADAVLGLLVGVALVVLSRYLKVAQLLPFLLPFIVTVVLWQAASLAGVHSVPLFAVCAPLVVLIPGAAATNGVLELSAGDVVSGGSRLISALVVWALLAAGIVAGAGLMGAELVGGSLVAGGGGPAPAHGWGAPVPGWLVWPATALIGIGVGLFCSARARLTSVIVVVLLATYGLVRLLEPEVGPVVTIGVASALVLTATRLLELLAPAFPSVVVFRPAYWLLVPGSFGLIALTTDNGDPDLIRATLATIIALTIGTQVAAIAAEGVQTMARARFRFLRRTRR
ncbi:uncharacterized membrane protein YjjP (DUF1212 family) [Kineosphaera limosa]|uniref:Threonine/serine exporter-like N-terminal domain-containing protein n=1 Tax=Kineosphaera limosa NBRC 100340 TaxID=1184609 RepID=K6W6F8_9MICO|nr:threonine/serine exporter family protein [Kineosphaera limosa]NYD98895.1 uncharacterized membrane protein YjjP (DUF1212 family) [Kineosphaera limosa]GAB94780.1 hypothetical protein KILIM_011_00530 [Kineosphaera limosa NBRC 100340]